MELSENSDCLNSFLNFSTVFEMANLAKLSTCIWKVPVKTDTRVCTTEIELLAVRSILMSPRYILARI